MPYRSLYQLFTMINKTFRLRFFSFILLAVALLIEACNSHPPGDSAAPFKRDIPTYIGGRVDGLYQLAKDRQNWLGLDSLENGFHDFQIRVWYEYSRIKERKLVVITNKDTSWSATIYELQVNWDGRTDSMLSKTIRQVSPKSGWAAFSKQLLDLPVKTLPTQDDVEGYSAGDDGTEYSVEVATPNLYRFYSYWLPQINQDKFWQAKKMTEMLDLLKTELEGKEDAHL